MLQVPHCQVSLSQTEDLGAFLLNEDRISAELCGRMQKGCGCSSHPTLHPLALHSVIALLLPHGITEWFGQELTFKGHLFQLLCSEQGHLHVDQIAHSPVQTYLERFQG